MASIRRISAKATAAMFVLGVLAANVAGAQAPQELAVGHPITDPAWNPEVIGWGHTTDELPAINSPTLLFCNFDGGKLNSGCGNDPRNNCSTLSGQFGGEILPFSGDISLRAAIVQSVRKDVEDFGVIVLGERPPDNQPYAMVFVGNSVLGGTAYHGFAGVAPTIDCGNSNPYITSFALEIALTSNIMATIINQEAAHTWGLEHVNDPTDNLHPTAGGFSDPRYNDVCSKIVANTDLDPSNGYCNNIHTQFCNTGNQNSYREMLLLFGPAITDTTPPTVTIDAPGEGEVLPCPAEFELIITLDDDRRPQTLKTSIYLDDKEVISGPYVNTTLKFPVKGGIAPGPHTWRVEAVDEYDNPATAERHFEIATNTADPACAMIPETTTGMESGSGTETDTGIPDTDSGDVDQDGEKGGCACSSGVATPSWAVVLLGFVAARRRHRDP